MVYRFVIAMSLFILSASGSLIDGDIKTFKANFVQNIVNESGINVEYKGEVYIKNNGKVLWKYFYPIIKNVYLSENIAIIDEPELEQAIYTKLEKSIDIFKLINESKQIEKNLYESKLYGKKYLIKTENKKISQVSYSDEFENQIVIKFDKIEDNIDLDDNFFQFIAPDYYDIIEK